MFRITLRGCPPSLNQFAGRENSWEYRKAKAYWTQLVWATCLSLKRPAEPYEFADVEIKYYFPTKTRHDADNYAGKFLLDGLTKAGVILDDDMAHIRLHVAGGYDKREPRTVITVRSCDVWMSFAEVPIPSRWKPEIDNGCRMWACPDCGGRMVGNFWDEGFCPYEYCPYCGVRNGKRDYSHRRLDDDNDT